MRDIIGLWAVCGAGRIGKIEREGFRHGDPCWFGLGISGHRWESTIPQVLVPSNQIKLNQLFPPIGDANER